jgi:urease accessory protein
LEGVLRHGAGWCDALFLAAAYRADDPQEVDRIARAFAPSAERLKETTLQGAAFGETTGQIWGGALPALTYPVALGHSARRHDLPLELTLQMYLQAFMANLVAAAMRLIPLGQTDGQRLIKRHTPLCAAIAAEAMEGTLDELSSTAFLSDIASMKHEQQYSRIFRT